MSTLSAGVVGIRQPGSTSQSPVYDVPFGTVQLASSSTTQPFDLASGFSAPVDYAESDEEGDDDDADSDDGAKSKGKKGKRARSEAKGERDLKTGRRKIKIEFIEDDARRHITFSKRKAGIMKKAYELATLTGTQVLLLVVSQTGLVYTFTTPKLQALVTQAEGRNLIQACLNAPDPPSVADSEEPSGAEDESDGGVDQASSPSESQASSKKQTRKRPRTASTSKSSSTPASANGSATAAAGVVEEEAASGSQAGTAKRGRGRPRKNTGNPATPSSAPTEHTSMPPPSAMHQSFSDDPVHHHHHQQQQQPQQYTHVASSGDFSSYTATANFTDLAFAPQVDTNHAWSQNMSNSNQTVYDPHPQHQHAAQQQHQPTAMSYATQHYGHFNPQQVANLQPHEIPRPAW